MAVGSTRKVATKKTATKKSAAKKAAAKKAAATTTAVKKITAKKTATKKPAAKQIATKKPAAKQPVAAESPRTAARKPPGLGGASASQRIDERIAGLGDWRGERLAQIRALIHEVDPDVVEEWKWMGTPVWSHAGMYVLANPHRDKVKLTFFHGAQLDDPDGLFNAGLDGGKWRAIDLREGDRIDTVALARLLRAAIAYNTTHRVAKSRGSRA